VKAFVWDYIDCVTENYHAGGGVLVIAESLDKAVAMIPRTNGDGDREPKPLGPPTAVYELAEDCNPSLLVFPDAGCC
jgi:hypothetical protein